MSILGSSIVCIFVCCMLVDSVHPVPVPEAARASYNHHPHGDKTETGNHFEGDIILKEGQKPYGYRKRREIVMSSSGQEAQAMSSGADFTHIWPNQTVYYTFHTDLSEEYRSLFQEAIDLWESVTCINFELAEEGMDYLVFVKSDELGCSSYVGKKGGSQIVSMNDYCKSAGHATHEIGHAIGLWHEHSRPDRNNYIEVLYDHIIETQRNNFGILLDELFELVPDVGYDTESIMHYGPYAFSDDSSGPAKRTIRLKSSAPLDYKHCSNLLPMGQRDELSYLDKLRANKLYSCTAHIAALEAEGRKCITPETTPTPTTTAPTKMMPSPTTTQPTVPTPSPPKRLASGSVITLRFDNGQKGIRCKNVCTTTTCRQLGSTQSCDLIAHQFQIVSMNNPNAKKIKSGSTVAFRSKYSPTLWLDCSNAESSCSISSCTRNDAGGNTSNLTTCDNHIFKIYGVGRREGKLINSNHSIQIRHEINESYLNCALNSKCTLADPEDRGTFTFTIKDE